MTTTKTEQFEDLARKCQYIPDVAQILSEIFKEQQFILDGAYMTASEVFDDHGFLPVFAFLAADRIKQLRGEKFDIAHEDSDESIVGFKAGLSKDSPASEKTMFLLIAQSIAKEIFGDTPSSQPIELDTFYQWVFAPEGPPPKLGERVVGDDVADHEVTA